MSRYPYNWNSDNWNSDNVTNLPTQSVKDFLSNKECIKVLSEEHGCKVIKYFVSKGGNNNAYNLQGININYYYFIDYDNNLNWTKIIPTDYTEITLPEELTFPRRMLVWDKMTKYNRLVIGKVNDLYLVVDNDNEDNFNKGDNFISYTYKYAEELPTYRLPDINGYKGIYNGVNSINYGCVNFYLDRIKTILNLVNISEQRTISSITLDSDVTITIEQLRQIVEYCEQSN